MTNYRLVFSTTTSTELRFPNSTVTSDGEMTYFWTGAEKVFGIPTKNVIAIERLPEPAPAEPPTSGEDA